MPSILHSAGLAVMTASALFAGVAHAEDRYGPWRPSDPAESANNSPIATLSWPGKAAPASPATATNAPLPAPFAPRSAANAPPALPTSIYAPAPVAYRPAQAVVPASPAVAAAPAQPMLAGSSGAPPRFYSVQRQYGVQPDPVALSAQFLADTGGADLAEPPPPPPPHLNAAQTANMSTAAAASQARAAQAAAEAGAIN